MNNKYYTIEEYRAARINTDAEYEIACERSDALWKSDRPEDMKEWWLLQAVIRAYEIRCDKELAQRWEDDEQE